MVVISVVAEGSVFFYIILLYIIWMLTFVMPGEEVLANFINIFIASTVTIAFYFYVIRNYGKAEDYAHNIRRIVEPMEPFLYYHHKLK